MESEKNPIKRNPKLLLAVLHGEESKEIRIDNRSKLHQPSGEKCNVHLTGIMMGDNGIFIISLLKKKKETLLTIIMVLFLINIRVGMLCME